MNQKKFYVTQSHIIDVLTDSMKILCRYVLAWMGALGIMNVYFCRINISTAMVAMVGVEKQAKVSSNRTLTTTSGFQCQGSETLNDEEDKVFNDQDVISHSR